MASAKQSKTTKKPRSTAKKPAASVESPSLPKSAKKTPKPAEKAPKSPRKSPTPKKFKKPVHPKAPMSFRRNVLPPLLGILFAAGILGLLNAQWLVAQGQYRFLKPVPVSVVSAAPASADPNTPPQLTIPKLNLTAPLITGERSYDDGKVQLALRKGVVQYGSSADPGQKGNLVVIGHSSGQLWAPGDYKFVFTLLDKLAEKDLIIIDFKGVRHIYRVSSMKVVPPTDLTVLQPTNEPRLTLITCTPVGTSKDRLIVVARQVSPDPTKATPVDPARVRPVTTQTIPN